MRPKGSADKLEARRRLGVSMLDRGLSLYRVGKLLGCPPMTVNALTRPEGGKHRQ